MGATSRYQPLGLDLMPVQYLAFAALDDLPDGIVDAILRTNAGARVGAFTKSGGVWRPAGPVDVAAGLPAIAHLLITAVSDATHLTVSSAAGVSEGDVMRWWDSSAAAELGDVEIVGISGNDLTLAGPGITGAAADDQSWRVSDMGVWSVGGATRDFTPGVDSKVTFPGGGMLVEQLGAGTEARCELPFVFSAYRTAIARFASGFVVPDVLDAGVILSWMDPGFTDVGPGYRSNGAGGYTAALWRNSVWLNGLISDVPSSRRALVMNHSNYIMSSHATPGSQNSYFGAAAVANQMAESGVEIICLGAGTSALLTGFESTSISEV